MHELSSLYSIKRLDKENVNDLGILFLAVYKRVRGNNFYQQKYDTGYTGFEYLGYIAYDKKMPVAFFGVIPCPLLDKGVEIPAAQAADAMTHPSYRLHGLFMQLAEMTFALCRSSGIQFVFGFPNQYSTPGLIKQGWHLYETMDLFIVPVSTIPLEKFFRKFPFFKKVYDRYIQKILHKYNNGKIALPCSVSENGNTVVNRNEDYRKYKQYNQSYLLRIRNASVWISINNGLVIGDMAIDDDDDFDRVMNDLTRIAAKTGVSRILFHSSPGTRLHGSFYNRYKALSSFHIMGKDLGLHQPLSKPGFTFSDIDIF